MQIHTSEGQGLTGCELQIHTSEIQGLTGCELLFVYRFIKFVKKQVMTDLILKYNLLDPNGKKEVLDFMDFLLTKEIKSKRPIKTDYKKKILKVSVWNDSDIDFMIQNQQKLNQWKAQEFCG